MEQRQRKKQLTKYVPDVARALHKVCKLEGAMHVIDHFHYDICGISSSGFSKESLVQVTF